MLLVWWVIKSSMRPAGSPRRSAGGSLKTWPSSTRCPNPACDPSWHNNVLQFPETCQRTDSARVLAKHSGHRCGGQPNVPNRVIAGIQPVAVHDRKLNACLTDCYVLARCSRLHGAKPVRALEVTLAELHAGALPAESGPNLGGIGQLA